MINIKDMINKSIIAITRNCAGDCATMAVNTVSNIKPAIPGIPKPGIINSAVNRARPAASSNPDIRFMLEIISANIAY